MSESTKCSVSLNIAPNQVPALTTHLAEFLKLDAPYPFPTAVLSDSKVEKDAVWCADGWTDEGHSVWLLISVDSAELIFGRDRPIRTPAKFIERLRKRDSASTTADLELWTTRLRDAVDKFPQTA